MTSVWVRSGVWLVCLLAIATVAVVIGSPAPKSASGVHGSGPGYHGEAREFEAADGSRTAASVHTTPPDRMPISRNRQRDSGSSSRTSPEDLLHELVVVFNLEDPESLLEAEALLLQLDALGLSGLIAVQQFLLHSGEAAAIDSGSNEESELRSLLLDFLLGSSAEEVESLAAELLDAPLAPAEIVAIGALLEQRSPGIHSGSIRQAAEDALLNAPFPGELPGSLFELLGQTGDYDSIAALDQMPMYRDAYVSVALSLLPDGSGIPLLEQDARLIESGQHTAHGRLALQLLAQQASQYPAAAQTLSDLARKGLIPQDLWTGIASLVSGTSTITTMRPPRQPFNTMTIYWPQGNQELYLVPVDTTALAADDISQRLSLIATLRDYAPPEARQFLIMAGQQLLYRTNRFSRVTTNLIPDTECWNLRVAAAPGGGRNLA